MKQELAKELKKAVKSLIKKTTGADEGTCLWYDPETKKFIIGEFDKNHKNRVLLYDKCAIEVDWDDFMVRSCVSELKLMLEDPQSAQYRYPQNIIDKARELVKIKEYVIDNYCDLWSYFTADDIFLESGAAEFMRKENIKHLIDTYTDKEVKSIINDPTKAEYTYPPEIISEVKKLAACGYYDYGNEDNEEILIYSGAADFILDSAIQENILYFTDVDKHYFNFLYHKAIEEYIDIYEWEF